MDPIPTPIPTPWYSKWYIKAIVILLVFIFIYIKIRPYIYHLLDTVETIRKLLNTVISFTKNVTEDVVDETSIGTKLVINKLSKPVPEPDESTNQTKTKGPGYCFVGEWKGIRSCVKVDKTPCSTQVYSTKQQCVNPELR